ncbi:hypothetical protein ABENE_16660 [Asticcacaulis benevestitus DSM 16100 = ATCC BAA-896]|uniref:Uncharacterized protein n=2 Tax=Asticcacaulis TaxID=76890 RepID=V4P1J9_9CAUL|nr:hypothetical protein ABENE_16660 [Asticcacaulis benevestitus DSM 16100 = ATCC BAA-896]
MFLISCPAWAEEFNRPKATMLMTPQAVDYTAEMVLSHPGQKNDDRTMIYRSGKLQREESIAKGGIVLSSYADLATGLSWRVARQSNGNILSLSVAARRPGEGYTLKKTSRTDKLLSETCTVWRLVFHRKPRPEDGYEEDCVTLDGVLLWHKIFYHDGGVMDTTRAVAITRRPVKKSEVTPPARVLNLASYGNWQPGNGRLPNDEVLLQGGQFKDSPPNQMILQRRMGVLWFEYDRNPLYQQHIYRNATHQLRVTEDASGALMDIDIMPRKDRRQSITSQKLQTFETILGERCQMFNMAPHIVDRGEKQCLTPTGLLLFKTIWSEGWSGGVRAVRLTRGQVKTADMLPPADILTGKWVEQGALPKPPPKPEPPSQRNGDWFTQPSELSKQKFYPARALAEEIEGNARIKCTFGVSGFLKFCEILEEKPAGYRFGKATVDMFRTQSKKKAGTYRPGDFTMIRYDWRLPDDIANDGSFLRRLNSSEVRALITKSKIKGAEPGYQGFGPNGYYVVQDQKGVVTYGTWLETNGQACVRMAKAENNLCFYVLIDASSQYYLSERVLPGPYRLRQVTITRTQ